MHPKSFASIFNASVYDNKANRADHGEINDVAQIENTDNGVSKRPKMVCMESDELPATSSASQSSNHVLSTSNFINTLQSEHHTSINRCAVHQKWKTSRQFQRKSIDVVRRVLSRSVFNDLGTNEDDEGYLCGTSTKPLCKANSAPLMSSYSSTSRRGSKNATAQNEMIQDGSPTKSAAEPSELDLLLQLIETEKDTRCTPTQTCQLFERSSQPSGSQCRPPKTRRCLKNGHLEKLQYTLQRLARDSKYLEQDNCMGLVEGVSVTVVSMESSFNVYLATVLPDDDDECQYRVLLQPHLGQLLYPGRRLQVFFDQPPYKLGATKMPIFAQPHKVIVIDQ